MALDTLGFPIIMGWVAAAAKILFVVLLAVVARWSFRSFGLTGPYWLLAALVGDFVLSLASAPAHAWYMDEVITYASPTMTVGQYAQLWIFVGMAAGSIHILLLTVLVCAELVHLLSRHATLDPLVRRLDRLNDHRRLIGVCALAIIAGPHAVKIGLWLYHVPWLHG
jgi:hypothetical protein